MVQDHSDQIRHIQIQLERAADGQTEDEASVQKLIDSRHARPDERDETGRTFLSRAASNASAAIVKIFLASSKVDPNSRDTEGLTPLSHAAKGGREAIVKILLRNVRVTPDSQDNKGRTALSYAVTVKHTGRVSGAPVLKHNKVARMLLENERVDPDSRDAVGRTPLLWAARNGPQDITIPRALLETGRVDPDSQDDRGHTTLWWAIAGAWEELVTLLLDTGKIDVEVKGRSTGRTLLSHAARFGNGPIVKSLLGPNDVNLNSKDNQGITPLMWAVEYGNLNAVDLLLSDGRLYQSPYHLEIDARYLAHWALSCSRQHGKRCEPSPIKHRLLRQIPDWVIDTEGGRLVPGDSVSRYIALSYVWVTDERVEVLSPERLMLTSKNLSEFQRRGCLQGEILARLPHTVNDAIVLVKKCKERYLWVDCLCIVQDSERTRDQVNNMGEIYAGAHFTIIAATASGRLNTRKGIEKNHGDDATRRRLYNKLFESKWATRGWTFQEQLLSKRSIVFIDGDVFWDCQACVWDRDHLTPESTSITTFTRPYYENAQRMSTITSPDFGLYIEMVGLYNSRDLTYPQDALPAISGVLSTLARSFVSGFVSGLPCAFLDIALLWQPYSIASRRVAKDGGSTAPIRHLPSWSWCGWRCPVDPYELRSRYGYIDEHTSQAQKATWKTHRLVQWYAYSEDRQHILPIDEPGSLPAREESAFDREAASSDEQSPSDGSGITMSEVRNSDGSADESATSTAHQSSAPSDGTSLAVSQLRKDWPFLSCETSAASLSVRAVLKWTTARRLAAMPRERPGMPMVSIFKLDQFAKKPVPSEMCHLICLADKKGNPAGVLRHMNRDRAKPGDVIELIALSTGSVQSKDLRSGGGYGGLFEEDMHPFIGESSGRKGLPNLEPISSEYLELRKECERYGVEGESGQEYHFYNVLWIERKDGIVYRKAAGRVPKVIWEANCTKPAKVVLG